MPSALTLVVNPAPSPLHAATLATRREYLQALRNTLADREAAAADVRHTLRQFESRYLREVGIFYAELDDWDARIAEREVTLYDSDAARERAAEARERARQTHEAAFGAAHPVAEFDPPPTLKALFREVAKRIHPDFARDPADQAHCTLLMARANQAYTRGDLDALQRILDHHHEGTADVDETLDAELERLDRQIAHATRDIHALDVELSALPSTEIAQLQQDAAAAHLLGRDLLAELAAGLQARIAEARYRHAFLERQIYAHGK